MKRLFRYMLSALLLWAVAVSVRADDGFDPVDPPEPMVQYAVSISATPAEGTSSITLGGSFAVGKTLTISVTPAADYSFRYWTLNGELYTYDRSFEYTVGNSAVAFVAVLELKPLVSVSVTPAGAGSAYGGGRYEQGANLYISTSGNSGYSFLYWTLNGEPYEDAGSETSFYYTQGSEDVQFVAVYEKIDEPFNPDDPAEPEVYYRLDVKTNLPDGVSPASIIPSAYYAPGKNVNLYVSSPSGYVFQHWTLNDVLYSDQPNCPYQMGDSDVVFTAHFATMRTISLTVNPAEAGTVSGSGSYAPNTRVLISTAPNDGYAFKHWLHDGEVYVETLSFYYIVSDMDAAFEAIYEKIEEPVVVDDDAPFIPSNPPEPETDKIALIIMVGVNNSAMGEVSGLPSTPLFAGDVITLTATPTIPDQYYFDHWADGSTANPREITLTVDARYVAYFASKQYTITFYDEDHETILDQRMWDYGATPTCISPAKADDDAYTYRFVGWTPEVVPVTEDAEYVAQYEAKVKPQYYTIRFLNWDGEVLQSSGVKEGDLPVYVGDEPIRADDDVYTYRFVGWEPEIVPVTENADYVAQYEAEVKPTFYTIRFLNWDGEVLQSSEVEESEMPIYEGEEPTRADNEQYTYTFIGWEPEIIAAEADADYTAQFEATEIILPPPEPTYYTIRFLNWDGEVLQSSEIEEGELPVYEGEEPTRAEDEQYTYTFIGWEPEIVAAEADADYTAQFEATEIVLPPPEPTYYTIRFLNWDGEVLQSSEVEEGELPVYEGEEPTRADDEQYTYTFIGWEPEIVAAEADADYTAQFEATEIVLPPPEPTYYTIRFLNWDGEVLQSSEVEEGELPVYEGEEPTRADDEQYTYTFIGWEPEIVAAEADADYTAQFEATEIVLPPPAITVRLYPISQYMQEVVYLYAWTNDGKQPCGKWPGTALEKDEAGWWIYTFEQKIQLVNMIWSDGKRYQTTDINDVSESACYQLDEQTMPFGVEIIDCETPVIEESAIEDVVTDAAGAPRKVLMDNTLYILRAGRIFTIHGQELR